MREWSLSRAAGQRVHFVVQKSGGRGLEEIGGQNWVGWKWRRK